MEVLLDYMDARPVVCLCISSYSIIQFEIGSLDTTDSSYTFPLVNILRFDPGLVFSSLLKLFVKGKLQVKQCADFLLQHIDVERKYNVI